MAFNTDKNVPVDMIIVAPTAIDGEHMEIGTVLKKCDTELAMELAGAGKARPWTKELEKDVLAQKKSEEAAVKARESANALAGAGISTAALADAIAQGVAAALAAQKTA